MDVREKLAELIKDISYDEKLGLYDLGDMCDSAEYIADLLISHGVTPVVRCKDCIHSYDDLCGLCCTCGLYLDCVVQPEFYCADGKRKEDYE